MNLDPESLQAFLDQGGDPNHCLEERERTLLEACTLLGMEDSVQILLEHGADPNLCSEEGWGPIHSAACEDAHHRILILMIEHSADVNLTTHWGSTPLIQAAWSGAAQNVRLLMSSGADPERLTDDAETALGGACHWRRFEAVGQLIGGGANILAKSAGEPPVYYSWCSQDWHSVSLLLDVYQCLGMRPEFAELFEGLLRSHRPPVEIRQKVRRLLEARRAVSDV